MSRYCRVSGVDPVDEAMAGLLDCYFYNPFDDVVMRKVLANLRDPHDAAPRRILVAYSNPVHADVFDGADFLGLHHASDGLRLYVNDRV